MQAIIFYRCFSYEVGNITMIILQTDITQLLCYNEVCIRNWDKPISGTNRATPEIFDMWLKSDLMSE